MICFYIYTWGKSNGSQEQCILEIIEISFEHRTTKENSKYNNNKGMKKMR